MAEKSLFDEMIQTEEYENLLKKLPEDERKELMKSLREMVENWENNVLKPLEKLQKHQGNS